MRLTPLTSPHHPTAPTTATPPPPPPARRPPPPPPSSMSVASALRSPPRWAPSRRRLLEQHLAALPTGLPSAARLRELHAQLLKDGLHLDPFVAPKLLTSYSLFRRLAAARRVFAQFPNPNAVLYNTLIRACANNSDAAAALAAFAAMRRADAVSPDGFTYSFLLKACSSCPGRLGGMAVVRALHAHVVKVGLLEDIFVSNSIIDAYSKAGQNGFLDAKSMFVEMPVRDVVSWNSMMACLVRNGDVSSARKMFDAMPERDTVSWNTMLDGHAKAGEMEEAFSLFRQMPERNVVSWSTVLSGYCKKGDMEMARVIFDRMPSKNVVTWTILASAYAHRGLVEEAGTLFNEMRSAAMELDDRAIASVLAACAESGSLALGKRIHRYVRKRKLGRSTLVCNALIDMFFKCGCVGRADYIFDSEMAERDVVSWNSMIGGFAMHGHGNKALDLFAEMRQQGFRPDGVTLINVLSACTHMGLIEEGRRHFSNMERDYGIVPQIEHYGCMVDLLGRVGLLAEAFNLIKSMPWQPNAVIWGSLLSACRLHKNVEYAEIAVNELSKLEPSDAGNYAVLSNIYAAASKWDEMAKARMQMKETGSQKTAGSSWTELDDAFHEFTVGDRTHPESHQIFDMVGRLSSHLKQVGYVPRAYALTS